MSLRRLIRSVSAITIVLPFHNPRQVAVPDAIGAFGQRVAAQLPPAGGVEQAQIDLLGIARVDREICPLPVADRAQRVGESDLGATWQMGRCGRTAGCLDHRVLTGSKVFIDSSNRSNRVASGGTVSSIENGWPWQRRSVANTAPPLPMFEPP